MNLANAILNTFYVILLSVLAFNDLRYTFRKRASKKWPSLQARIESVTVGGGRASALFPELKLTYAYFVDGIRYTGFFFLYARDNRKWFHQDLTGKSIVIRYDTRHPGISFLSDNRIWGKRVIQGPYWAQRLGDR
jgi:hypothetical protein